MIMLETVFSRSLDIIKTHTETVFDQLRVKAVKLALIFT